MAASTASALLAVPAPGQRLPRLSGPVVVLIVVLGFLVLSPLVALLYAAFLNAPPGVASQPSLTAFTTAWSDPAAWSAAWTSLWLAAVRMTVVIPIAVFLTWAITRTNMPMKELLEGVLISHIFMPFLPLAMAWAVLASPRSGLLNSAFKALAHVNVDSGPINIFSYGGLIWLTALGIPPYLYLLIAPAFRSVDTSLEEAARTSGASALRTLRKVTIPVLTPALLGAAMLVFLLALQSFEPELIIGIPAHIYVFSTQIYRYIDGGTLPQYGPATALSLAFLVITFGLVLLQSRVLGNRQFTTISGKSFRTRPMDIGRWKYLVLGLVLTYIFFSTVLPLATLVLASLMHIYGYFGDNWFTTEHYLAVLQNPKLLRSVVNTLILAAASATLGMLITSATAYINIRTRLPGRKVLDLFTWMPITVPGIVLAVGMIWAYVSFIKLPFHFYGSLGILVLAVTISTLPTGARLMNGTMAQLSPELEESGRVHGASFLSTARRVLFPLLTPAILSGWLTLFANAVKNFATVSLLYAPASIVISALQYELWNGGKPEDATALGSLNMAFSLILVVAYVLIVRRRSLSQA